MLSNLHTPDGLISDTDFHGTNSPAKPSRFIYIKPILLAIGTTVLMSFLVCISMVGLAKLFLPDDNRLPVQDVQPKQALTGWLMRDKTTPQKELNTFIYNPNGTYDTRNSTTAAGTFVNVPLDASGWYWLHLKTSYQELATPDSGILRQLMRQLDAQGIEYGVTRNTSNTVLLFSGEWIINWGGLLYLPDVTGSFE